MKEIQTIPIMIIAPYKIFPIFLLVSMNKTEKNMICNVPLHTSRI